MLQSKFLQSIGFFCFNIIAVALAATILMTPVSTPSWAFKEADAYENRIRNLQYSGESDEAVNVARQFVGAIEKKYGAVHKHTSYALHAFGVALFMDGQYTEAEKALKKALKIDESLFGPNHPDIVRHLDKLATIYYSLVRFEEADRIKARANKINQN